MDFKTYLEEKQPFVYQIFKNAREQDKVAQTYLIKGNDGAPILETALFLAKSLICEQKDQIFACGSCLNCIRFDENNYSDFYLIDGNKSNIKVSDIEKLQEFIASSSMEKQGKKIYIINCLENSNKETLNALLKTLEEPHDNIYAFITTRNENKLLPTILSRCQSLNLLPIEKNLVIKDLEEKGVSSDDIEILTSIFSNTETILNVIDDENYKICKECLFDTLDALEQSSSKALIYVENELVNRIKTKEQTRLYLDLLSIAFKDIINLKFEKEICLKIYQKTLENISKNINNVDKCYLEIMLSRGKIELNISIGLLLEHIFISIIKGGIADGK